MSVIRVMLIDDHEVVRRGLRAALECDPGIEVVGDAGQAQQAIALVSSLKPDVALLDLQLPDASGPQVCWSMAEASPQTAIVILTAFLNPQLLKACLLGGARGYVLKEAENLDLPALVRAAHAGQAVFDPQVAAVFTALISPAGTSSDALTLRELQVLQLMSEGLTNKQIGDRLFLSPSTVKGYVREIMTKLGCQNRVEAVVEGRARNLI